jgi:hypothetical protein
MFSGLAQIVSLNSADGLAQFASGGYQLILSLLARTGGQRDLYTREIWTGYCSTLQFTVSGATATHRSSQCLALPPHTAVHRVWCYRHTPSQCLMLPPHTVTVSGAIATHRNSQCLVLPPHTVTVSGATATHHSSQCVALPPHTAVHSVWRYRHTPQFTVSGASATHRSSQCLALPPHTAVHSVWRYRHTPQFTPHWCTPFGFRCLSAAVSVFISICSISHCNCWCGSIANRTNLRTGTWNLTLRRPCLQTCYLEDLAFSRW